MAKLTQQELEAYLWGAAKILRGKTAGQDYKTYILTLLFFNRLSDSAARRPILTVLGSLNGRLACAHTTQREQWGGVTSPVDLLERWPSVATGRWGPECFVTGGDCGGSAGYGRRCDEVLGQF